MKLKSENFMSSNFCILNDRTMSDCHNPFGRHKAFPTLKKGTFPPSHLLSRDISSAQTIFQGLTRYPHCRRHLQDVDGPSGGFITEQVYIHQKEKY